MRGKTFWSGSVDHLALDATGSFPETLSAWSIYDTLAGKGYLGL
jgi:hypothetical protein